jgi:hypothetical protein
MARCALAVPMCLMVKEGPIHPSGWEDGRFKGGCPIPGRSRQMAEPAPFAALKETTLHRVELALDPAPLGFLAGRLHALPGSALLPGEWGLEQLRRHPAQPNQPFAKFLGHLPRFSMPQGLLLECGRERVFLYPGEAGPDGMARGAARFVADGLHVTSDGVGLMAGLALQLNCFAVQSENAGGTKVNLMGKMKLPCIGKRNRPALGEIGVFAPGGRVEAGRFPPVLPLEVGMA